MGTMRSVVEMNGGKGAPAVVGGKEVVGELLDDVGKLSARSIGAEEGRRGVSHGEQKVAADGDRRYSSGSRCGVLGIQLGGRKASRDWEEST
jgi:hypothetical protein